MMTCNNHALYGSVIARDCITAKVPVDSDWNFTARSPLPTHGGMVVVTTAAAAGSPEIDVDATVDAAAGRCGVNKLRLLASDANEERAAETGRCSRAVDAI